MDLVNGPAIGRMLGVTKQHVYRIARKFPDWPTPVVNERRTILYRKRDIEAWMAEHWRRPAELPADG